MRRNEDATHTRNRFKALFSGTTRVSQCQKKISGLHGAKDVSYCVFNAFVEGDDINTPP